MDRNTTHPQQTGYLHKKDTNLSMHMSIGILRIRDQVEVLMLLITWHKLCEGYAYSINYRQNMNKNV